MHCSLQQKMIIVSIALPVYNAAEFLDECFNSILKQIRILACDKDNGKPKSCRENKFCQEQFDIQVSVYEDGSTDKSPAIIKKWAETFNKTPGFSFCLSKNESGQPKGVGYGRNRTIRQSLGEYICFCDADDVMEPARISVQLKLCMENPNALIGSRFRRIPEGSTKNFTFWANQLTQNQLHSQIYLSFGPSIVMPTWFCHRSVYSRVDEGFDETGKGVPEDLIFFYRHLDQGGEIVRADNQLMVYRYHSHSTTFSVTDEVIRNIRMERLEQQVLRKWNKFSIWNAGKLGRRFYRSLSKSCQDKVACFCDVDNKKIGHEYHPYPIKVKIPILHVKDAPHPFVICVKTELTWDTCGDFRRLLDGLNLQEGVDYFYFN